MAGGGAGSRNGISRIAGDQEDTGDGREQTDYEQPSCQNGGGECEALPVR